jgi:hypothetical protein
MSKHAAQVRTGQGRASLYDEITGKVIAELEAGRVPWVQPWGTAAAKATLAIPKNASRSRPYSGVNILILWGAAIEGGFTGQSWLTFRQALSLGGHVRKGERGTTVVYADRFVPNEAKRRATETGEEAQAVPFLKRFTVTDKRILKLIRGFLTAGVMEGGLISLTEEGTPQGGPLSPLLSSLMLDVLDKELEKRGHRFVRYTATRIIRRTAGYGPVCPVVWEGRRRKTSPYPDSIVGYHPSRQEWSCRVHGRASPRLWWTRCGRSTPSSKVASTMSVCRARGSSIECRRFWHHHRPD